METTTYSELFEGDWSRPKPDPRLLALARAYKDEYRTRNRDLKDTLLTKEQKTQILGQILPYYRVRVQDLGLDYWNFLELCQKD